MADFPSGRVDELSAKKVKVDLRDKKILSLLSVDARMPLSLIAKRLRVSRDVVDYRIRRMVKNGIILGFVPLVNLGYFGYDTYHVFMVVHTLDEVKRNELIRALVSHSNTKSVMEYHDAWDLEWVLVAKSLREFDSIVVDVTSKFRDVIVRKDKLTIVKGFKSIQLPGTIYRDSSYTEKLRSRRIKERVKVDSVDVNIVRLLSQNSRMSSYEISLALKISPDAVGYRIKRLVSSGVIFGFTVLVNLNSLNYHLYTLCIDVKTFDISNDMRFREFISSCPFVLRAVKVLGDWDLLVYITADTQENFHLVFKQVQANLSDVISDCETWLAYKEHVFNVFPECVQKGLG